MPIRFEYGVPSLSRSSSLALTLRRWTSPIFNSTGFMDSQSSSHHQMRWTAISWLVARTRPPASRASHSRTMVFTSTILLSSSRNHIPYKTPWVRAQPEAIVFTPRPNWRRPATIGSSSSRNLSRYATCTGISRTISSHPGLNGVL